MALFFQPARTLNKKKTFLIWPFIYHITLLVLHAILDDLITFNGRTFRVVRLLGSKKKKYARKKKMAGFILRRLSRQVFAAIIGGLVFFFLVITVPVGFPDVVATHELLPVVALALGLPKILGRSVRAFLY